MNDKMTPDKERENCPCRKAIINPFDAMMMVVVRRLDKISLPFQRILQIRTIRLTAGKIRKLHMISFSVFFR